MANTQIPSLFLPPNQPASYGEGWHDAISQVVALLRADTPNDCVFNAGWLAAADFIADRAGRRE